MTLNEIIFMLLVAPFLWGAIFFGGFAVYYSFAFFPVAALIVSLGLAFIALPIMYAMRRSNGK